MTRASTMVRLLDAFREHLAAHRLPEEIAYVEAGCGVLDGEHVRVLSPHGGLSELAAALVAWADTLTGVVVTEWRPPSSRSVHLNLTGRLSDSTRLVVFGAVDYSDALFGDLQPDGRQGVSLSVLRAWTAGGSAVAA